jgi:hypothetical protein
VFLLSLERLLAQLQHSKACRNCEYQDKETVDKYIDHTGEEHGNGSLVAF